MFAMQRGDDMKKKLLTIRDAAPWFALSAFSLLVCALVAFSRDAKAWHYAVTFAATGGTLLNVALHFWWRWKVVDAWNRAPKLPLDVAVYTSNQETLDDLFTAPDMVLSIWFSYACKNKLKGTKSWDILRECLAGCDVTFMPAPWMVNGVLVGGTMVDEHCTVVGPEFEGIERTRALIIHELSHRALEALGIPAGPMGENHHRIFAEEGLGY